MEIVNYYRMEFEDMGPHLRRGLKYIMARERNIRGTATREEEKILEDEGVPFIKFPVPDKKK
jgi:hypothetical protein